MSLHKLSISCEEWEHSLGLTDPIHRPIQKNELDLWFAPIAPLANLCSAFINELSETEIKRANRFHFEKDRTRFIVGHYLLRVILAEYVDCLPKRLQFEREQFGKPFLKNFQDLHFNFSDTKDAILVGVTQACSIGVDVETITRSLDHDAVAEHYFTPSEIEELKNAQSPKTRFLEFWTRKEAILKASGVGIMDDVRVLRVNQAQQVVELSHADMISLSSAAYHVRTGLIGDKNIISFAAPQAIETIGVFDALQL